MCDKIIQGARYLRISTCVGEGIGAHDGRGEIVFNLFCDLEWFVWSGEMGCLVCLVPALWSE
jgi:hypothetical protein